MISEEFSEKKRGRPKVLSEKIEETLRGIGCYQQRTRRGRLNEHYFFECLSLFRGSDGGFDSERAKRWNWLHYNTYGKGSGERWRRTIMAEIGRLRDRELMTQAADLICELKPSAREAVNMIRRWRVNGRSKPANCFDLGKALCRAFIEYRSAHADLAHEDALITVIALRETVAEIYSEGAP